MSDDITVVARRELPDARLDQLESRMLATGDPVELSVTHIFTSDVYRRTILIPAGTLLTSRIHKTEHHYVVVTGSVSVYIPGIGVEFIRSPYFGVTQPGTRRVLYVHEDCIWATYHPTTGPEMDEPDVDTRLRLIEERIIERRELAEGKTAHELYSLLLDEAKAAGLLEGGRGCPG
jgi:hypothetical protein